VILTLAAIFFFGPLIAATKFALQLGNGKYGLSNFGKFATDPAIRSSLLTSLQIGGLTVVIVLVLMVPTVVYVRLRLPRLTLLLESVTILPIVIPPVVMAAGLASLQSSSGPGLDSLLFASPIRALTPFYVILAMPFTYRSLDTGVRAICERSSTRPVASARAGARCCCGSCSPTSAAPCSALRSCRSPWCSERS
jgi:putative spermidine/putrescine transport system permease protein